jgi:hypothetical protein
MQQEKYPTPEQAREAWDLSQDRLRNMAGRYDPLRPESERQQRDERPAQPERAEAKQTAPAPEPEKATKEQERPAAKEQAGQGERWQDRPATKMEEKIFRVMDAADRGGASVAAALHAEGITLARADAAGIAAKNAEYRRAFESETSQGIPDARLRRSVVQEGELVAVTKSGDVFRLNQRFLELDKLERAATGGKTPTLSAAREFFAAERQQQKDDRAAARETLSEAKEARRDQAAFVQGVRQGAKDAVRDAGRGAKEAYHDLKGSGTGFKVVDAKGFVCSLASFIENLWGDASPAPDQQQHAPQTGRGGGDAYDALEEIYERSQRGEDLSAESIRNLPAAHWENLRSHGDAYMHSLIREFEREKEQEAAQSWAEYDHERMGRER